MRSRGVIRLVASWTLLAILCLAPATVSAAQIVTPWEDFEGGLGDWYASAGTWEVGQPLGGPGAAHGGNQCAATLLDDYYPWAADSRLISPLTTLPSATDGQLWLSLWQWFLVYEGDSAYVEIKPEGAAEWTAISESLVWGGAVWTRLLIDLSAYAGQSVQLAFHFKDNSDGATHWGWYLDDLAFVESTLEPWLGEDFEGGLGGWYASAGTWEVGPPLGGPGAAHGGSQCAATVLNDHYPGAADSRLVSPLTTLPSPADGQLWLSLWQWFAVYGGDSTAVEIKPAGAAEWTRISESVVWDSGAWTRLLIDLSAYAGQNVQLAFRLKENGDGAGHWGWYLDDLEFIEGALAPWLGEDFEGGLGDWYASAGTWEVGPPLGGPGTAHSGSQCAATVLNSHYPGLADSRLVSPLTTLPDPGDGQLWLSLWQWFAVYGGDSATVEIKPAGAAEWTRISESVVWDSGAWTRLLIDLSAYAGQNVQLAFRLKENGDGAGHWGWYLDDLEFIEGALAPWLGEDFEGGLGDWYASAGIWEVGQPQGGPDAAHSGSQCAATILNGHYPGLADSRLVSPLTTLPDPGDGQLWLSLWQWFAVYGGDSATVEIKPAGAAGWTRISESVVWTSEVWTRLLIDLSAYAGQNVQLAFRLKENGDGAGHWGWYLDDLEFIEGALAPWTAQDFEGGIGDWYASAGIWEVGRLQGGPGAAHSGSQCAATILNNHYPGLADSRLVSPLTTLPDPADGQLWLSLWQWFAVYGGDSATVEIKPAGAAEWTRISESVVWTSEVWTRLLIDLSAYAGQSAQFAFHFKDNGDGAGHWGWYLDDLQLIEGALAFDSQDHFEESGWARLPQIGGWHASAGLWEIGVPLGSLADPRVGLACAATTLASAYPWNANSRLISAEVTLPTSPQNGELRLSWRDWHSIAGGDSAFVEISVDGQAWERLGSGKTGWIGGWYDRSEDIAAYAGQRVRFAFHFVDNADGNGARGWAVDRVSLVEGPPTFNNPECFDSRTRGWFAPEGVWEIGQPLGGPDADYDGSWCAGTDMDGHYPYGTDARLITKPMTLPSAAQLRFFHWYSFAGGDQGRVQISVNGGAWQNLAGPFVNQSGTWTPYIASLAAYAGQSVRLAFLLQDNSDGAQDWGWYIDCFRIQGLSEIQPSPPVFTSVDYSAGPPVLTWETPGADTEWIAVYADHYASAEDQSFVPEQGNRIALVQGTSFVDEARSGCHFAYRISAVGDDWQESEAVAPGSVTALPGGDANDPGNEQPLLPLVTRLAGAHPNPFNPKTTLVFELAAATNVQLDIYDISGRKLRTLLAERRPAGVHRVDFDAEGLASGVYLARLVAGDVVETRKLVMIR